MTSSFPMRFSAALIAVLLGSVVASAQTTPYNMPVKDGTGAAQSIRTDRSTSDASLAAHSVPEVGGAAVSTGNPEPVADAQVIANTSGVAQGAASSGAKGAVVMGVTTASSPSDSANTVNPLSLDASGSLRVTIVSGASLGQGTATSGEGGALVMGAVTTSPPSYTTGNTNPLSLDAAGNLRIVCITGCAGGSGGTSATDAATFTYGSSTYTPTGGVYNSSPTPLTSGQGGANLLTPDRKLVSQPYALGANQVAGNANTSGTSSTLLVAAPAIGQYLYITGFQCMNGGATGTTVSLQNGSGGPTIWQGYAAAQGGGFTITFATPLGGSVNMTAATGLYFQAGSATSNLYCNAQGYKAL